MHMLIPSLIIGISIKPFETNKSLSLWNQALEDCLSPLTYFSSMHKKFGF